jgi:hypothetical protein
MKFDGGGDDAIHRNRKCGACERRGQLRNELGDLDLLIYRKKFGFRGGARWGLSRGCRDNYIYAGRERQNPSHDRPLAAIVAFQLSRVDACSKVPGVAAQDGPLPSGIHRKAKSPGGSGVRSEDILWNSGHFECSRLRRTC